MTSDLPLASFMGLAIPIIAIVMGMGTGAWSIYLNYRKRREMFALVHQERMAAIEKGIELPPLPEEFFREDHGPRRPRSAHSTLLLGLILLFLGLAVWSAMFFTGQGAVSTWSFVLIGLGAAFLIYYFAVDKKQAALLDAQRAAETATGQTLPKN